MSRTRPDNRGFTLMEIMLVGAMTSLLAVFLSAAWSGFGQPSADALVRCRVMQEAQLAAASLAADFGGSLANQFQGTKQSGRMVGRMIIGDSRLWLCFDGGSLNGVADWGTPDTVITYGVQANQLIRSDLKAGTDFVVASNVEAMALQEQGDGVKIELTFSYRDITQTYTLITRDP